MITSSEIIFRPTLQMYKDRMSMQAHSKLMASEESFFSKRTIPLISANEREIFLP